MLKRFKIAVIAVIENLIHCPATSPICTTLKRSLSPPKVAMIAMMIVGHNEVLLMFCEKACRHAVRAETRNITTALITVVSFMGKLGISP